jgi:hypothetical protein
VLVLILVTVTFVAGDFFSSGGGARGPDLTFGYNDKAPITLVPGNKFSQIYEQLNRRYRDQIDPNDVQANIYLWSQAFEAAAVHMAILRELEKSNYEVPVNVVDREMARLPQFQDDSGRFSPALYRQMSDTSRLSLWRQVRDELAVITFYNDLFGLLVPQGEVDFISKMASDMRTFDLVAFSVDDYPDAEYLSYANENAGLFSSIHLSRIVISSSEREAKKILESINNGTTTFEDAARAQSQDGFADRGGDMGLRYVYDIEREITDADDRAAILALGRGEISGVIKFDTRWAFYRVEDALKSADFDDYATMERVRSYMRNSQRGRMEDWAIAQAREFIGEAEADGFNNAARWRGKERRNIGPIAINYGNVDLFPSLQSFSIPEFNAQELIDLSRNSNFWQTAFSTPLNTTSEPMVHGNYVLVFYPLEQSETDESRAEEIASMYSSYWLSYVTEQSLQTYFMNSPKMDNRFWDTYYRFFIGNNQ